MEKAKVCLGSREHEEKLLYIAGKLFKDADIKQRLYEKKLIEDKCNEAGKEIKIYNPISNDDINLKSNKTPTAHEIFIGDLNELSKADIILAELDDEDPGTMYELGLVTGINFIYDLIKEGYTIEQIMKTIPQKSIYGHMSDIRQDSVGCAGKYIPWGISQFVIGGVEFNNHGKVFRHVAEAVDEIIESI